MFLLKLNFLIQAFVTCFSLQKVNGNSFGRTLQLSS